MEDVDIAIYEIQVLARLFIIYQKMMNGLRFSLIFIH